MQKNFTGHGFYNEVQRDHYDFQIIYSSDDITYASDSSQILQGLKELFELLIFYPSLNQRKSLVSQYIYRAAISSLIRKLELLDSDKSRNVFFTNWHFLWFISN